MIMRREIGEKGQVVIPKDIREMLKLKRGERVVFEVRGNEVVLRQEQDPIEFLENFLNTPKIKRGKKSIKKMILEQYEEGLH
ncbi:AbrB/MazE/SpoVT family DNA-binding domain-containing protein [Candidatus Pacearchaeota archaeon]|nr:AbrB/MazE/SpoVT family DNA-binding domain-containing protein [Candidatus Pacearchaeota archaeon]